MNARERRQQLNAALQAVLEDQDNESALDARQRKAGRRAGVRKMLVAGLVVGWLFIVWVWVAKPGFLFGTGERALDAAHREASLRYSLYLQRSRIDRHAAEFGSLPATLQATGQPVETDVIYIPSGTGYVLIGRDSTLELELTNRMSVDSFLGSSLDILRRDRGTREDQ